MEELATCGKCYAAVFKSKKDAHESWHSEYDHTVEQLAYIHPSGSHAR